MLQKTFPSKSRKPVLRSAMVWFDSILPPHTAPCKLENFIVMHNYISLYKTFVNTTVKHIFYNYKTFDNLLLFLF